jgi:large subunit ribosomal protein L17
MRHRIGGRQFGLPSDQRRALLKGLIRSLFINQKITTTVTRAKDVRILAERLITIAKRSDTLHGRRQANKTLTDETLVRHLFTVIAPEFRNTAGGYTRITRIGQRRGDAAEIVLLELATDREFGRPVVPDKIGK